MPPRVLDTEDDRVWAEKVGSAEIPRRTGASRPVAASAASPTTPTTKQSQLTFVAWSVGIAIASAISSGFARGLGRRLTMAGALVIVAWA